LPIAAKGWVFEDRYGFRLRSRRCREPDDGFMSTFA
jgi:hypothetical protein